MPFYIQIGWMYFCIALGLSLLMSLLKSSQAKKFFLMHMVIRKFSILDLQFPASAHELASVIGDIFELPNGLSRKAVKAVKTQLYLDFIFMPAVYGTIFILSMNVSMKMIYFGHKLFAALAWLQIVSWICDIIENVYLLNKLKPKPVVSSPTVQKAFERLEVIKWSFPLIASVCSLAAIFYYWIVGNYNDESLYYIALTIVEVLLFFIIKKLTTTTEKQQLESFEAGIA